MEKSKLLEVFKTLDKQEIKDFGKYLEGNGYKKNTKVHNLYVFISKQYPDFDSKKIEKNYVIKKMSIKVTDNLKRLQALMNRLYASLEDYIVKVQLEKEKVDRDFLLLKALQDRNLDKYFFNRAESLEKEWEDANIVGIDHLFDVYKLSKMHTEHPNLVESERIAYQKKLDKELEIHFFTAKIYRALITSYGLQDAQLEELTQLILEQSKVPAFQDNSQISFLSKLLQDKSDNNIDNYDILIAEFKECYTKFNQPEQWDIIAFLENYCLQNYHKGKKEYLQKIFELFVFGAKHQIILENGIIDETRFRQMVVVACSQKELEWAEKFIKDYSVYLNKEVQYDNVQFCQATLDFEKANFEQVLDKLIFVKFKDIRLGIQAKSVLLMTYYELEDYEEQFFSLVKSLSTYLRRNADLQEVMYLKEPYSNFIKYIKKLQMLRYDSNMKIKELLDAIETENVLSNKLWLINKVNQIKQPS